MDAVFAGLIKSAFGPSFPEEDKQKIHYVFKIPTLDL